MNGHASDGEENLIDRVAVLAVTASDCAADLAERMFRDGHGNWTTDELVAALLGEPNLPGDPALRPIARSYVKAALADNTLWSYVLPQIAELEPEAVIAVYERLRELGAIGMR